MDDFGIWGRNIGKEKEKIERLVERYLKWILGIEERTSGYLVREELERDKLWSRAGRKTMAFEKKFNEGKGNELARRCWKEMRERYREGKIKSLGGGKNGILREQGIEDRGDREEKGRRRNLG